MGSVEVQKSDSQRRVLPTDETRRKRTVELAAVDEEGAKGEEGELEPSKEMEEEAIRTL